MVIMNSKSYLFLTILILLLCRVNIAFSQEWEYSLQYTSTDDERLYFYDTREMSNGNIGVASSFRYRSGYGDFYSAHPAVVLLSSDGVEIARNSFFRQGYTSMSYAPYLFENNGYLYALSTYSPEHDFTCPNYFLNYDNPPTDAKLVLSKLDNKLNLLESYEHSFPIDTFEKRGWQNYEVHPNEYCGNIFMFSAFEDDGNIIGLYMKSVSADYDNPRGFDSLFFFRMNFEGEMLNIKGYKRETYGGWHQSDFRRNQIVKTESNYIFYEKGDVHHGRALYYDKDFNHVATKYIVHPDYEHYAQMADPLRDISVVKVNDNTTYLSVTASNIQNVQSDYYNDCRLYKLDDDIEILSDYLSTENYMIRGNSITYDRPPTLRAIDVAPDSSLYFACNYDLNGNSYCVIEHLNENLDTISTHYYESSLLSIKSTSDGSLILNNSITIAKFPATAFGFEPDNIEEAHVHNLHLAVAYPNPGGDVLNIRTGLRNGTLQVYDIQGRIIHQQIITDEVTSVDASKWNSGTYIWKLTVNNEQLTVEEGKWIK